VQGGLAVMTGDGLCVHQAAAAFALFVDQAADIGVMRAVMADGRARAWLGGRAALVSKGL
jgi:shikimate 5-dehydrogenase